MRTSFVADADNPPITHVGPLGPKQDLAVVAP
ncbi:MAG: hypothetical protein H6Q05_4583, partial [Acidobacteria bacterium]|nr:hypothetical protein [Acidobacteriota bacterium]